MTFFCDNQDFTEFTSSSPRNIAIAIDDGLVQSDMGAPFNNISAPFINDISGDGVFNFHDLSNASSATADADVTQSNTSAASADIDEREFTDFVSFSNTLAIPHPVPVAAHTVGSINANDLGANAVASDGDSFFDDDDDFAEFSCAPAAAALPMESSGEAMENDNEEWGFPSSDACKDTKPVEVLHEHVRAIVSEWREKVSGLFENVEVDTHGEANDELTILACRDAWEDDGEDAIPQQVRKLLVDGVTDDDVIVVPFANLGLSADTAFSSSVRSKVKDSFLAALGKYLQLPTSRGHDGVVCAQPKPAAAPTTKDVTPPTAVTNCKDLSMLGDADWGLFESTGTGMSKHTQPTVAQASDSSANRDVGSDVLSQTLFSIGLQNQTAAPPPTLPNGNPFEVNFQLEETREKKQLMPAKVQKFLDSLPNLSHLTSRTILAP